MAGGKGTRLGYITKNTPKPIIKLRNKPFLEYLLKWLLKNGFKKFYFLLSYKNNKIEKFLKKFFSKRNIEYIIFLDKRRSGTFSALKDHIKKIDKVFFYTNADEISNFNIKKNFLKFKISKTKIMCGLLKSKNGKYSIDNKKKNIKLSSNNYQKTYIDCGYKFINKEIFKKTKKKFSKIEDFIYQDYLKKNKISYFIIKKKPLRIDTAFDIKRTKNELFKSQ
tara:strand:+ start:3062 stop:3727 length:666 start_codon:yes stop_codon:yes gene_type:complete